MKQPSQPLWTAFRMFRFLFFLFIASLVLCQAAASAPSITLSKTSGPPTSRIIVSGVGFGPNVGVDIFFDTKDKALVVTNGKGEFHDTGIYAPRGARPGEHWVTALERNNDKGAQRPFLVRTNWSQFHFAPSRDGVNRYENVLNPHTVRSMSLKWSYSTSDSYVWGSPTVVDGVAYVATWPVLYALGADSGDLRWSVNFCCPELASSDPTVADGMLYIGSFDTGLHALDAKTGAALWNYPGLARVFSAPVVANGMVFFDDAEDDNGDGVYALDAKTGKLLWFSPTSSSFSSPAVADGVVYVGADDNNVYALDAFTGVELWRYTTDWVVRSSPAIANGVVYVGSWDRNVYAINATTGTKLWNYATGDVVESSPAVADGVVYVGSDDHNVYALDAFTGAKLWSYTAGDAIGSSPAVANGVVYVGSRDGNVYALKAATGVRLWSYTTGYAVGSSPAVANGVVLVGSYGGGKIYSFGRTHSALAKPGLAKRGAVSNHPDPKTLRPDLNLGVSVPGAREQQSLRGEMGKD